jgi:hypothetical protein
MQGYLQKIVGIVRLGQLEKKIRSDVRAETIAIMFGGLIHTPAILFHSTHGKFNIQKQAKQAWIVFSDLVRTK